MTNVKFFPPTHTTKMYSIIVYYSIIIINYIMYNKGKFSPPKLKASETLFLIHQLTQTPYARNNQTLEPRGFQAVIHT